MSMELQGTKAVTHDFLSLYTDSASQDSMAPPPPGFLLETHEFLQPPERPEKSGGGGGRGGVGDAPADRVDVKLPAAPEAATETLPISAEAVRPSGFCTYTISHMTCYNAPPPVAVKPDWFTCAAPPPPPPRGSSDDDRKTGFKQATSVVAGVELPAWNGSPASNARGNSYMGGAFTLWGDSPPPRKRGSRQQQQQQQQRRWPSPSTFPAASAVRGGSNGSSPCVSSSRQQLVLDKRPAMASASKSDRFIPDEDEDDDDEGVETKEASSRQELAMKVDGGRNNRSCSDQKASTPRSKHSETEQRRRGKINDRFRVLRDIIPHSDQKRDKASLLLEVIEYVHVLQEKVQKYESLYPGWNQDNTKLTPWKTGGTPGECMVNPSHFMKTSPPSTGFTFPAENAIPGAPTVLSNNQIVAESENACSGLATKSASVSFPAPSPAGVGGGSSQPQQRQRSDSENIAQHQAQWLRPCAMESSVSSDILSGEEEVAIDNGTISLSGMYSEGLLTALTRALKSSGINLSQASISVQINLGRHAITRAMSNTKDLDSEELEQASKRHKSDFS